MTEVSGLSELLAMPVPRPLTVDDLFRLPDDGWRYELVDGSLIVSPPPVTDHQRALARVLRLLDRAVPDGFEVVPDAGLELDDATILVPDVVVVRSDAFGKRAFRPDDLLLVVEVVSPSNARNDLVLKPEVYASVGIPGYWILDGRAEPRITVLALAADGQYRVTHEIGSDETVTVTGPVEATLNPRELLR